ncbi:MAG: type IV secretory system conjugative DNA transfer family protein [Salinibacterium sp.]|nr:type IV secretory system conjugative DNA transfer family protein [Salinibacterium sp.]
MNSSELRWHRVHWPTPLHPDYALALLYQLASETSRGRIVWETRGQDGQVSHHLAAPLEDAAATAGLVRSLVPGSELTRDASARIPVARVARLRIEPPQMRLAVDRQVSAIRAVLAALVRANRPEEWVVVQVVLGRAIPPRATGDMPDPTRSWFDQLATPARPASRDVARQVRDKRAEPGCEVAIRIGAKAASEARQGDLIRGVLAAMRTLQSPGLRIGLVRESVARLYEASPPGFRSSALSSSEMLSLLAWPLGDEDYPGLPTAHPKRLPPAPPLPENKRTFATSDAPGKPVPLGISAADSLLHTSILGATGSGKSTVLLNLITADMKAGRSVVVIDPKGDLAHDVLARIPTHRRADVVVLDPTHPRPVGLNPLRTTGSSPELVADRILSVIRDLFPTLFGPRTSDVLHASLLTLARRPDATLAWLPRLLTDASFRAGLIGDLHDPDGLDGFWASFNAMSVAQQGQFVGPVLSRLRQFLLRPQLRRVLDQSQPRFDLQEVFTARRILVVPLNTGLLGGDSARLLGSLLVGQLWQLALARSNVAPERRHVVSVFIDETHEFLRLGGDLSDALARSRSLGVAWHLAHQFREQFSPDTRAAVDANTLNKIVFTLGNRDAREVAAMAPELEAEDFMTLDQFEVYAHLMRGGRRNGWASGRTLTPPPITSEPLEIIASSQERYGLVEAGEATPEPSALSQRPDDVIGRRKRARP